MRAAYQVHKAANIVAVLIGLLALPALPSQAGMGYGVSPPFHLDTTDATPLVVYAGPSTIRGSSSVVIDEVDNKISPGDNVRLRVPFSNTSTVHAGVVTVTLEALDTHISYPSLLFSTNEEDWEPSVSANIFDIGPGQTKHFECFMYVGRVDPDDYPAHLLLPPSPHVSIGALTGFHDHNTIATIRLEAVHFPTDEFPVFQATDFLRHPSNHRIMRYAQYLVGAAGPLATGPLDPDTPIGAARNATLSLHGDVGAYAWIIPRQDDFSLLDRRHKLLFGNCIQFSDLLTGVLRSIGLPARLAHTRDSGHGHVWVEVYLNGEPYICDASNHRLSPTFNKVVPGGHYFNPSSVTADTEKMPNWKLWPQFFSDDECVRYCYESGVENISLCRDGHDPFSGCYEDVTYMYKSTASKESNRETDNLIASISGPLSITEHEPHSYEVTIANTGQVDLQNVSVMPAVYASQEHDEPYLCSVPESYEIESLGVGEEQILEFAVTALHASDLMPLVFYGSVSEEPWAGPHMIINVLPEGGSPHVLLEVWHDADTVVGEELSISARVRTNAFETLEEATVQCSVECREGNVHTFPLAYSDSVYTANIVLSADLAPGLCQLVVEAHAPGLEGREHTGTVLLHRPFSAVVMVEDGQVEAMVDVVVDVEVQDYPDPENEEIALVASVGDLEVPIYLEHVAGSAYRSEVNIAEVFTAMNVYEVSAGQLQFRATVAAYGHTVRDSVAVSLMVPDVTPLDCSIVSRGGTQVMSLTAENRGTGIALGVVARVEIRNGEGDAVWGPNDLLIEEIEAGSDSTLSWFVSNDIADAAKTAHVVLDPNNAILESNKSNNEGEFDLQEEPPASVEGEDGSGESEALVPAGLLTLRPPIPNPTTGESRLEFGMPSSGAATLSIYDVAGREVRRLRSGEFQPGWHSVTWDGRGDDGVLLSQGVYFARLRAGAEVRTERVTLIR